MMGGPSPLPMGRMAWPSTQVLRQHFHIVYFYCTSCDGLVKYSARRANQPGLQPGYGAMLLIPPDHSAHC